MCEKMELLQFCTL